MILILVYQIVFNRSTHVSHLVPWMRVIGLVTFIHSEAVRWTALFLNAWRDTSSNFFLYYSGFHIELFRVTVILAYQILFNYSVHGFYAVSWIRVITLAITTLFWNCNRYSLVDNRMKWHNCRPGDMNNRNCSHCDLVLWSTTPHLGFDWFYLLTVVFNLVFRTVQHVRLGLANC